MDSTWTHLKLAPDSLHSAKQPLRNRRDRDTSRCSSTCTYTRYPGIRHDGDERRRRKGHDGHDDRASNDRVSAHGTSLGSLQKGRGERCRRDSAVQFVTVDRGARTKASAILSRALAATRKVDGRRGAPRGARRDGEGERTRSSLALSLAHARHLPLSLSPSHATSYRRESRIAAPCVRSPVEFTR